MELAELRRQLHLFAEARDWQPFHTPKNLAASVAVEAAELLECFQWLDDTQARNIGSQPKKLEEVCDELADVLIYLVHLADVLDIDLADAVTNKIMRNELRFPPAGRRPTDTAAIVRDRGVDGLGQMHDDWGAAGGDE
jgi:NTP pyrophosphatase (non-canonical NTP hydrolase)